MGSRATGAGALLLCLTAVGLASQVMRSTGAVLCAVTCVVGKSKAARPIGRPLLCELALSWVGVSWRGKTGATFGFVSV